MRTAPEQHGKTSKTRNACILSGAVVVGVVGVGYSLWHGSHTMPNRKKFRGDRNGWTTVAKSGGGNAGKPKPKQQQQEENRKRKEGDYGPENEEKDLRKTPKK